MVFAGADWSDLVAKRPSGEYLENADDQRLVYSVEPKGAKRPALLLEEEARETSVPSTVLRSSTLVWVVEQYLNEGSLLVQAFGKGHTCGELY
jgi:hypothetical protein